MLGRKTSGWRTMHRAGFLASMGPSNVRTENQTVAFEDDSYPAASMGPSNVRTENSVVHPFHSDSVYASMGPSNVRTENALSWRKSSWHGSLQWGRPMLGRKTFMKSDLLEIGNIRFNGAVQC